MNHDHIHAILAAQRSEDIARNVRQREPRLRAADAGPVLSLLTGIALLLVIAAPSL